MGKTLGKRIVELKNFAMVFISHSVYVSLFLIKYEEIIEEVLVLKSFGISTYLKTGSVKLKH